MSVATPRVEANPALLVWARLEAGFTVEEAARKLAVTPDRLISWELGDAQPTLAQLRKASEVYARTLATFFLVDIPDSDVPAVHDFRGLATPTLSAALRREMRRAVRRRSVLVDLEDPPAWGLLELPFVGSLADTTQAARELLGVPLARQVATGTTAEALKMWIAAFEASGIAIFQMSRMSSDECRGFSVYYDVLPVIVLNGAENEAARVFTLMHELAHLLLRNTGVCLVWNNESVEQRCNAFASQLLMPANEVRRIASGENADEDAERVAKVFKVSYEAAAVRLRGLNLMTQEDVDRLRARARELVAELRRRQRESEGGPPHFRTHLRNLGDRYVSTVLEAYEGDRITFADAANFLEAKVETVERMEAELDRRGNPA